MPSTRLLNGLNLAFLNNKEVDKTTTLKVYKIISQQ